MKALVVFAMVLAACDDDVPLAVDASPPPDAIVLPATGVQLPLVSLDAYSYTVAFGLGAQQFDTLVDTGSTTTAVASVQCPDCGVTPAYDPSHSGVGVGVTASTYYEDNSGWSGVVFDDTARLPGLPSVALDFAAITSQTDFFDQNAYQGILGLGPALLIEPGTISYMERLGAGRVPQVMAFRLCPDRGDMWIGGFDPSVAAAPVQYTPILPIDDTNPFYSIQIADLAFGGTKLGFTPASFGPAVVDTGTSISYVPARVETAILSALNNNAAFKQLFPNQTLADTDQDSCVTGTGVTSAIVDAKLPAMAVKFPARDGGTFSIDIPPSRSYLVNGGDGSFCLAFSSSGTDPASDGSTIGDTLMAGMLTVFDLE
ncbi:MAG TPA: pepsin-like aspartyl protease, partial [Kofleriaceae bacterium]|nr:pepsin-like aspartyl protease [Kofleriaceae bacterium]